MNVRILSIKNQQKHITVTPEILGQSHERGSTSARRTKVGFGIVKLFHSETRSREHRGGHLNERGTERGEFQLNRVTLSRIQEQGPVSTNGHG